MTSITPSNINTDNLLLNGAFKYWYSGTGSTPDGGWALLNATVARESTIVKVGDYSAKITCNGNYGRMYVDVADYLTKGIDYYANKTVTLGFWYYAPSGNDRTHKVAIESTINTDFTDDDSWHWKTISHTFGDSPSSCEIKFYVDQAGNGDTDDILYIDGLMLVEGSIPFAYTEHKQDVVGMEVTSAPSVVGADYERAWYSSGGTRRLYMCDGSDWKYVAIST
jgi:hypothetical protein